MFWFDKTKKRGEKRKGKQKVEKCDNLFWVTQKKENLCQQREVISVLRKPILENIFQEIANAANIRRMKSCRTISKRIRL